MHKKQLTVALILVFLASGCFPVTNAYKRKHIVETTLDWYAYWDKKESEANRLKVEYQKKIERYLELRPQTSKEVADNMRNCRVTLGMTEVQVLSMVRPQYILKGKHKNEKIFKYSDVGKFGRGKFIGEGTKVWITFTNGVVTDMTQVDLLIGN